MRKKVKLWVLCLAMLLCILSITACSSKDDVTSDKSNKTEDETGKNEGNEKTKITFLGWGSDTEIATFEAMIEKFEAKYTDVDVDYLTVPATEFSTKLQTMIAGNKQPDVFYLFPEDVMKLADSNNLYDMSEYVSNNEVFAEENIWSKGLDMYRYDGTAAGQGAIYGLPKDIGPFALAYNKDLFAAAGVDNPDPDKPWTWDEFVTNAKKLTSGEGADKVYGTAAYSLESAIWSNGADWLDASKTKITIDDPKFIEALQWVADLQLVHGVVPSSEEEGSLGSFQRWMDGKIAMMGIGPWNQAQFWEACEFEWDLMPWPVSPATGKNAIWYGGMGFGVSPSSKNIEAACNLAAFLAFNEDAQRTNYEMGQAIPNLIDMTKKEYLAMDKLPQNKQEFIDIIETYGRRATQTYTYSTEWWGEFNSGIDGVMLGDMTAEEYCTSIKDDLQSLLDKGIKQQQDAKK